VNNITHKVCFLLIVMNFMSCMQYKGRMPDHNALASDDIMLVKALTMVNRLYGTTYSTDQMPTTWLIPKDDWAGYCASYADGCYKVDFELIFVRHYVPGNNRQSADAYACRVLAHELFHHISKITTGSSDHNHDNSIFKDVFKLTNEECKYDD